MKLKRAALAVSLAALVITGGCKKVDGDPSAVTANDGSEWGGFVEKFLDGYFKINPTFAVYQGKHEFDGELPDWSPEGIKAAIAYRKQAIADAKAIDASKLTDAQKFERDYFVAVVDGSLFWRETADWPHKNPTWYGLDPGVYLDRPYADLPKRMADYAKWASNIAGTLGSITATVSPSPMPRRCRAEARRRQRE